MTSPKVLQYFSMIPLQLLKILSSPASAEVTSDLILASLPYWISHVWSLSCLLNFGASFYFDIIHSLLLKHLRHRKIEQNAEDHTLVSGILVLPPHFNDKRMLSVRAVCLPAWNIPA